MAANARSTWTRASPQLPRIPQSCKMPWQGQRDNLIDRFDVRAHLDYIAPAPRQSESEAGSEPPVVEDADERSMNYERFRVLAQNEFLGIVEEKYLHQLYLEEQFGVNAQVEAETKAAAAASKKKSSAGAAIGYTYEETEMAGGSGGGGGTGSGSLGVGSSLSSSGSVPFSQSISAIEKSAEGPSPAIAGGGSSSASTGARFDECMKDESDSDLDMDVSIDINKIGTTQAHELNACGRQYGMQSNDFYSFLTKDADEADALRMAREEEQEKIMFSGRKSRRERRAQRERKFAGRPLSPPSYAAKEELVPRTFVETNDSSRSPSPVNSGKITYITSFGGEDELQAHGKISFGFSRDMSTLGGIAAGTSKAARLRSAAVASGTAGSGGGGGVVTYAEKVKQNLEKLKAQEPKEIDRKPPVQYQRQASTGRGRRGGSRRSASSSSGSSRRGGRRSRARRRSSSSSSSSSGSSSSSRSHKRGRASKSPAVGRRTRRLPDRGGRSRSPSKGRRTGGSRHAAHSRSHRRRSKSDSRSRSRSRSRTRWSPPVRRRSPRYGSRTRKATPKRSSSSSTSSSRSRSRTPPSHSHRTQTTTRAGPSKRTVSGSDSSDSSSAAAGFARKLRTQTTVPQEKKKTPLAAVITPAILSTLPLSLPPPPPPPPLPPAALSTASEAAPVEEKKPILAPLALIEPEPLVPIKRYYGRRRGDESSSDDGSSSGEDVPSKPSTVEDRKPVITGLLDPDTGCVDDSTGSSCKYPSGELGGLVQIKQEKPDTNLMAIDPLIASGGPAAGSGEGLSASLRFGKTVPGGTGASESKAGILSSGTMSTSSGAATVSGAPHSKTAFNPRDRLKRKMQILLNKQYKADKKAEIEKVERQIQQQQERDDEMRELALKLRRRQRELRHKYGTQESDRSKSHTSDERSSGDEDEAPVSMGQPRLLPPLVPPVRYAQLTGREGSCSPQRQPLLAAPHQSSPHSSSKVPSYMRQTSGSTRSEGFTGTGGYRGGSSAVIERKPVLRSDSSTMQATAIAAAAAAAVAPPSLYGGSGSGGGGGDLGRLRRRNSPTPLVPHGGPPFRGQPTGIPVPTHSMNLRRAGGGGGGPPAPGGRFDDRTRRRTPPARFNRSRSPSRERIPSGRDVGGGGGRMTGRRMDYGRSRDYDRYHHGSGGGGPQSGFSASSGGGGGGGGGGSSGRYRSARRSRSGSRGRRSRSPGRRSRSPSRGRGNGGGSSSQSGSTNSSRQTDSKPVKKLVDY
ncbi:serine/arginine repetitive matrix protein 2-like isoform X2 [Anopheles aquasalis]|uniref:serine/arginine repetitive matrix protein 2-like isoform X2 n=1 Tax=Anopheles aquasalis TaxID=42839 RepID=UPI00215AFFE6|nr:serine/arginine repetitive matrix protein 2-like isoform X2 [Anopheles aquasalis]